MRKDLFDLVAAFSERGGCEGLTAEQTRFVEREIRNGKRNGLHLDDEKRKEITEIKKKMADLGTQGRSDCVCSYLQPMRNCFLLFLKVKIQI